MAAEAEQQELCGVNTQLFQSPFREEGGAWRAGHEAAATMLTAALWHCPRLWKRAGLRAGADRLPRIRFDGCAFASSLCVSNGLSGDEG